MFTWNRRLVPLSEAIEAPARTLKDFCDCSSLNWMWFSDVKLAPLIVTRVPRGPELGEREAMVGTTAVGATFNPLCDSCCVWGGGIVRSGWAVFAVSVQSMDTNAIQKSAASVALLVALVFIAEPLKFSKLPGPDDHHNLFKHENKKCNKHGRAAEERYYAPD